VTLNMWTTRHGRLLGRDAMVIQVDCEADAIGAHHRVDLGLLGDAAETARAIDAELERRGHRADGWRSSQVAERIEAGSWSREPYEDMGTSDRIDPRTLSRLLDEVLPAERTFAVDSGHFMGWPAMYLRVPDARGFAFTQGLQGVGLGLASGIGAAIARPDRLAVGATAAC
jgi:thiamine pyrophosphate-dependent acetolactate synthase large subunit-like protein